MPQSATPAAASPAAPATGRRERLIGQLRGLFENVAGFDMADADVDANFIELGLDSLMLTQVAVQLQKTFDMPIGFRQLMGDCSSLDRLAGMLDEALPAEAAPVPAPVHGRRPRGLCGAGDRCAGRVARTRRRQRLHAGRSSPSRCS